MTQYGHLIHKSVLHLKRVIDVSMKASRQILMHGDFYPSNSDRSHNAESHKARYAAMRSNWHDSSDITDFFSAPKKTPIAPSKPLFDADTGVCVCECYMLAIVIELQTDFPVRPSTVSTVCVAIANCKWYPDNDELNWRDVSINNRSNEGKIKHIRGVPRHVERNSHMFKTNNRPFCGISSNTFRIIFDERFLRWHIYFLFSFFKFIALGKFLNFIDFSLSKGWI